MKNLYKKILAILAAVSLCFGVLISCKNNLNLDGYISQLRLSVYEGENQNFKATIYAEKREVPFNADGIIGEIKNALIIKVEFLNGSPDDVNATISYGVEKYETALTYNPVSQKSSANIYVQNLPTLSSVNVEITSGDSSEKLTLSSVIFDNTITYTEALNSVVNANKEKMETLFSSSGGAAEIHVRIILGDGKNYYYVGVVEKGGKTTAYLIDGEAGSVLAKKEIGK